MSPLEIMAKAAWDFNVTLRSWGSLPPDLKGAQIARMRAALLALAECELPGDEMTRALDAQWTADNGDQFSRHQVFLAGFRSMLRSIAENNGVSG